MKQDKAKAKQDETVSSSASVLVWLIVEQVIKYGLDNMEHGLSKVSTW